MKKSLNKLCKGCNSIFYNVKGYRPSHFMRKVYCSENCRIKNSDFKRNYKDYSGKVFNGVKVLRQNGKNKGGSFRYDCLCHCGNEFNTRISRLINGVTTSCGCYQKEVISRMSKSQVGEKSPRWNPSLTDEQRISARGFAEVKEVRNRVFIRDSYTCVLCGQTGGKLNAHHLNGWNWCIEGRFDTDNCVTLCESCHNDFHVVYGKGNNTKEQFEEFKQKGQG